MSGQPPVTIKADPGEREALKDETGKTLTLLGTPMTVTTLRGLPTSPDTLRAHLERLVAKGYGEAPSNMDEQLFENGAKLIMNFPVSPEVRAATFRMLAALPGATAQEEATDPSAAPARR